MSTPPNTLLGQVWPRIGNRAVIGRRWRLENLRKAGVAAALAGLIHFSFGRIDVANLVSHFTEFGHLFIDGIFVVRSLLPRPEQ